MPELFLIGITVLLRWRLNQFEGDAIWIGEVYGISAFIHTSFNGNRFLSPELNTQPREPLELCMNIIHRECPTDNNSAVG